MDELRVISAKVPDAVYKEMVLRVPEGDRSGFIRDAIVEKLEKTPKADKLLDLERRMSGIEMQFAEVKKCLADLELLTYDRGRTNPHEFCMDDVDHKLMDFLLHYKGATTPQLAEYVKANRWLVLNRLKKMQKASMKQLGKPIVDYYAGEKSGKKKAWWLNKELLEAE